MSRLNVDKITGATGTASGAPITLSGDTATLGSSVTVPASQRVIDCIEPLSYLGNYKSNHTQIRTTLPLRTRIYHSVRMEKNKKALTLS